MMVYHKSWNLGKLWYWVREGSRYCRINRNTDHPLAAEVKKEELSLISSRDTTSRQFEKVNKG